MFGQIKAARFNFCPLPFLFCPQCCVNLIGLAPHCAASLLYSDVLELQCSFTSLTTLQKREPKFLLTFVVTYAGMLWGTTLEFSGIFNQNFIIWSIENDSSIDFG